MPLALTFFSLILRFVCLKSRLTSEQIIILTPSNVTITRCVFRETEVLLSVYTLLICTQCFMEPLKKVQVEGFLMFAEPQDLFGNLDELCYVSIIIYTGDSLIVQ